MPETDVLAQQAADAMRDYRFQELHQRLRQMSLDPPTAAGTAQAPETEALELHAPATPPASPRSPAPPAPAAARSAAPPPGTGGAPPTTLTDQYDRLREAARAATAPFLEQFQDATRRAGAVRETSVRPAIEGVRRAAQAEAPPLPPVEPLPTAGPSLKARPFLDGPGKDALSAVLSTLSLLGQVFAGAKQGAPLAAVSALTGAMKGWAAGDTMRADRAFKEYVAEVDRITTQNEMAHRHYVDALAAAGANQDKARAVLTASLAEAGLEDHAAEVALKGAQVAGQQFDRESGILRDLHRDTLGFMQWQADHDLKAKMSEWMLKYQGGLLDIKREALEAAKASPFGDAEMDTAARLFILRGQQPAFGMGASARPDRARFWRTVHKLAPEYGGTEGIVARQASIAGLRAELVKVETLNGLVEAFSGTARRNLADAKKLSDTVDRTQSPMLNKWLLAGRKAWSGDPAVVDFDIATRSSIFELGRVLSSATAAGVVSDSARREIEELLSTAFNKEQFLAAFHRFNRELDNRREAYKTQIDEIQTLLRATGRPEGKATPTPPHRRYNPATGAIE